MKQYLDLLDKVLQEGEWQHNRTGVDTLFIPGHMMQFDLRQGFPVITTRKAAWKSAIGEMIAFINGYTNAADFRNLKCKFWDQNANENQAWLQNPYRKGEDDLGEVYGHQWRNWQVDSAGGTYSVYDQFYNVIDTLVHNPTSRRMIVSGWRPDRINRMALPPCHVMYQFLVGQQSNELHMSMYIRSNDLFLGAPANIIEYAWLLEAVAHATGYTAATFSYFVMDAHIYQNHTLQVAEQLTREPRSLPKLKFLRPYTGGKTAHEIVGWLEGLHPDDFELEGYDPHPPIAAPMAV